MHPNGTGRPCEELSQLRAAPDALIERSPRVP